MFGVFRFDGHRIRKTLKDYAIYAYAIEVSLLALQVKDKDYANAIASEIEKRLWADLDRWNDGFACPNPNHWMARQAATHTR